MSENPAPEDLTTLHDGEPHPAAHEAKAWIAAYFEGKPATEPFTLLEAFSSTGMSGNRTAQICGGTLKRLLNGEPVSDRYVLGLAWVLRNMASIEQEQKAKKPTIIMPR